jgi:ParB family transcriptional regulator, chromosome partitioning protein
LPEFIRKDLDLKPRLLGGTAADEVVSTIKKHGDAGVAAAKAVWGSVVSGALDQGKLAAAINLHVARGIGHQGVHERNIEKIFAGKSHAGTITKDSGSFTVKIKTGVLSEEQEREIRKLISSLFSVRPG